MERTDKPHKHEFISNRRIKVPVPNSDRFTENNVKYLKKTEGEDCRNVVSIITKKRMQVRITISIILSIRFVSDNLNFFVFILFYFIHTIVHLLQRPGTAQEVYGMRLLLRRSAYYEDMWDK